MVGTVNSRYLVLGFLSLPQIFFALIVSRASLSHGTPKHITRGEWDVPLPDLHTLQKGGEVDGGNMANEGLEDARSFISLCSLTEILGDVLPLIYTLQAKTGNSCLRSLRRLEASVDEWEDSLPEWLDPRSSEFRRKAGGALNLQLSFLAVKMCICRIALQVV